MWLFAGAAALIFLLLGGQALARENVAVGHDAQTLRGLGMTRRQILAASLLRTALLAGLVAGGGALVAILASRFTPVGFARSAEVSPGTTIDLPVILIGALVIIVASLLCVLPSAWRQASGDTTPSATSPRTGVPRLTRVPRRLGLPVPAGIGVGLAVDPGRGRAAVPVRAALVTVTIAVAAVTGAFVFGASLSAMIRTPSTYGWTWDSAIGNPNSGFQGAGGSEATASAIERRIRSDAPIDAVTAISFADATVGHAQLRTMGIDTTHGVALPPVLAGRHPVTAHEVAMTASALRDTHRHLGDQVSIGSPAGREIANIVGVIVSPPEVLSGTQGGSVELPMRAFDRLDQGGSPQLFLVRYRRGVDADAASTRLRHDFGPVVLRAIRPADIENLVHIAWMPFVLAGLLGLLALGTLAHVLIASVRRRRRDFAVLKTVGLAPRQVSAIVAWQASTFVVLALVIGVPLGVVAGRVTWRLVTDQLGLLFRPSVPLVIATTGGIATLVLANLLAAAPAWLAGRIRPAQALRSE
jgi:hypothetical protein